MLYCSILLNKLIASYLTLIINDNLMGKTKLLKVIKNYPKLSHLVFRFFNSFTRSFYYISNNTDFSFMTLDPSNIGIESPKIKELKKVFPGINMSISFN